jgi:hypothetical protein
MREGRVRREEGGEAVGWAARREKKEKNEKGRWAGPNRKREGKRNVFQMHLNLNLNFKFKWKTTNTCTKPIFPYISFYVLLN